MGDYSFRTATEDWEFEQIHRLNYRVFVEEVPQHEPNPERRRVDPFHQENTYIVGLVDEKIIAMVALRSTRPFSLDAKLDNLDQVVPHNRSMVEIRLLYVIPEHRNAKVVKGLLEAIGQYGIDYGHDLALISGTTRQQRFYRHLGFVPFGPVIREGEAQFQPMYLTLEAAVREAPWLSAFQGIRQDSAPPDAQPLPGQMHLPPPVEPPVNFMPGPVSMADDVWQAFTARPISHRSNHFVQFVQTVKQKLCALTGAQSVELLFGSGTLANEAIAAQLSLLDEGGVILTNGEFGERLVEQAHCWQLSFTVMESTWGEPFDYVALDHYLAANPSAKWIWCVHSETSTGVLNSLERLTEITKRHNVRVCIDCVSSIGAVPIYLRDVYLASGTSGKALGAPAGVALVFSDHEVKPSANAIPRYVDIGYYAARNGVPFTIQSNLVYALGAALERDFTIRYAAVNNLAKHLRYGLETLNLKIVADATCAFPEVVTIALPESVNSVWLGDQLAHLGYLLSYKSRYLVELNWVQVCLMGDYEKQTINEFLNLLAILLSKSVNRRFDEHSGPP